MYASISTLLCPIGQYEIRTGHTGAILCPETQRHHCTITL